jgi:hypothetical protein
MVKVLSEFAQGLAILDDYDHEQLEHAGRTPATGAQIEPSGFLNVVVFMRRDFDTGVFGKPKDQSF